MRWFWIDRFTRFECGRMAEAVKCISVLEEYLDEYFPGNPIMTPSLVIEGFAQMGGLLVGQNSNFETNIVLAKVNGLKVYGLGRPGDRLRYLVEVQTLQPDGGLVAGQAFRDDELLIEAELTFAEVSRDLMDFDFFQPVALMRMLRIFKLFEVGVDADGQPMKVPEHLLAAEKTTDRE